MAAAITAGAVAQFFQWSVIEGNNRLAESREIRSYFIRGAVRLSLIHIYIQLHQSMFHLYHFFQLPI